LAALPAAARGLVAGEAAAHSFEVTKKLNKLATHLLINLIIFAEFLIILDISLCIGRRK